PQDCPCMQVRNPADSPLRVSFYARGVAVPRPGLGGVAAVTPPPIAATGEAAGATLAAATPNVPAMLPRPRARLLSPGSVVAASAMNAIATVRYMRVSLVGRPFVQRRSRAPVQSDREAGSAQNLIALGSTCVLIGMFLAVTFDSRC